MIVAAGPALALSIVAFGLLALSMRRHYREVIGHSPSSARALLLRTAGWTLLVGSFLCAVLGETDIGISITQWFGTAMAAALLVTITLTYIPLRSFLHRDLSRQGSPCQSIRPLTVDYQPDLASHRLRERA